MDIDECFRKGLVRKTEVDKELILSLIDMSAIKEKTVNTARINPENISVYVSVAYDSLREMLEAICIKHGYKVLSHTCMGELLRGILDEFDHDGFDRLRYIRNSINYYGKRVDHAQGKELIRKIFLMKNDLLKKHL
ncbi:MAG: hypothetical protein V1866_06210 [archaeon]